MAVRRYAFRLLQNGGAVANAHTVAGQWRHFTAFPYIPGVFVMGHRERTYARRLRAVPECIPGSGHDPAHSFVTHEDRTHTSLNEYRLLDAPDGTVL